MAKDKPAGPKGLPNRHLHARTTFLYQAASYLTMHASGDGNTANAANALQLGSHLRAVSLKGQVRLSGDIKRSMCKTCSAILIPGRTATHVIENKSKDGKKPWADVLEVGCNVCGSKKRFPVGATRQPRQPRQPKRAKAPSRKDETKVKTPVSVASADNSRATTSAVQTPTDLSSHSS